MSLGEHFSPPLASSARTHHRPMSPIVLRPTTNYKSTPSLVGHFFTTDDRLFELSPSSAPPLSSFPSPASASERLSLQHPRSGSPPPRLPPGQHLARPLNADCPESADEAMSLSGGDVPVLAPRPKDRVG
jgi:hypothetical protein